MPNIDWIGREFGLWRVLSQGKRDGYLLCLCQGCNNQKEVGKQTLKRGTSTKCLQCRYRSQRGKQYPWGPPQSSLSVEEIFVNRLFYRYRQHAEERGLEWKLTREEFSSIIKRDCYWGGCAPKMRFMRKHKKDVKRGRDVGMIANGIDRLDNSLGYTLDNTVPCCKEHNTMKSSLPANRFLELVKSVYMLHCRGVDESSAFE